MPASRSSKKLNTVVVTPEDISPTKPDTPSGQLCPSSRTEGRWNRSWMWLDFFKKCRLHTSILTMGDTAVANAAPASPIPMGKMNR